MKKVVVFGGSGFLGSYVIDALLEANYDVKNADIKQSEYHQDECEHLWVDITNPEQVNAAISEDTDIVLNYAGLADINISADYPLETAQLNIMGNIHILEACRKAKIKRYIYASSAYANSEKGSFYGISKLSAEKFIEEYAKHYGFEYTILRYGSLYGKRANEHNGVYRMLKQAVENNKIVHHGNGEEVREYIHCLDAAKLTVGALKPEYKNKHLILTGVEKLKQKDLLIMLQEIFDDQIEIEYSSKSTDGHYAVTPYSFKPVLAQKIVNNPYIDLGQGLLECIVDMHEKLCCEI